MKIMALDIGKARTGVAVSDESLKLALPFGIIEESDKNKLISEVLKLINKLEISIVVVGIPLNMDASIGNAAKDILDFVNLLKEKTNIIIDTIDERFTTLAAHNYIRETHKHWKSRKKIVDSIAATIILQNYIDRKKSTLS